MKKTKKRIKGEKAKTTKAIETILKSQIKDWNKRAKDEKEERIREIKKRNALKRTITIVFTTIVILTIILLINEKQKEGITETETKQTIKDTKLNISDQLYSDTAINNTNILTQQVVTIANQIMWIIPLIVIAQILFTVYKRTKYM